MGRAACSCCLRPQSGCICAWITPLLPANIEVLILQHPLEVAQVKGSARLLHLSLANSCLLIGESFDERVLLAGAATTDSADRKQNILLYPALPSDNASPAQQAVNVTASRFEKITPAGLRLIVIDGTWRKSRKMLYLNPWLQRLPRLALQDMPASHYLIRKAHKPDQLSTLEATCAALAQLEGDAVKYLPLLQAFDGFVAQQMAGRLDAGTSAQSPRSMTDASATPAGAS